MQKNTENLKLEIERANRLQSSLDLIRTKQNILESTVIELQEGKKKKKTKKEKDSKSRKSVTKSSFSRRNSNMSKKTL